MSSQNKLSLNIDELEVVSFKPGSEGGGSEGTFHGMGIAGCDTDECVYKTKDSPTCDINVCPPNYTADDTPQCNEKGSWMK